MRVVRSPRPWLVAVASLWIIGCIAPSADEIKAEFAAYVAGANRCTTSSECVIAEASCPLGCTVAVRVERQADVEAKARALIKEYERVRASCAYDCVGPVTAVCTVDRCAVSPIVPGR